MLSPLIEYDEKKESVLMETLGGYFKCNCNIKQMAQMQYIHYNTALYRLEQIEKLLKIDLKNPDDKLNVELALKLSNYLK
jgi:purine catabolism regulator